MNKKLQKMFVKMDKEKFQKLNDFMQYIMLIKQKTNLQDK